MIYSGAQKTPTRRRLKITHRYILLEILPLFGITTAALTFVFLLNKIFLWMDLVLNKSVPVWDVFLLYASIIPFFMAVTVPMSALVATLLAFGRLSSDMEVTALKSSGIHLAHLVGPVVVFGLLLTGLMLLFNDRVLPASNFLMKKVTYRIVKNRAHVAIKERVFINDFEGCQIYIDRQSKNGLLSDIRVFMRKSGKEPLQTITARSGKLITNPETLQVYLLLSDGVAAWNGTDEYRTHNRLHFKSYLYHLNLSNSLVQLASDQKDFMEMTLGELRREIDKTPDAARKQRLKVEYQKRISLPFACFVVTWLSSTLGLRFRRGGFLAFAYGVLLVFIYYLLFVLGETLAIKEGLDAVAGTWTANIVFAVVGLLMYHVVILERSSYRWCIDLFRRRRAAP